MSDHLSILHVAQFANRTPLRIIALQARRVTGGINMSMAHTLLRQNCKAVFVDVVSEVPSQDFTKIEAVSTPQSTVIMPVHCYGNSFCRDIEDSKSDFFSALAGSGAWIGDISLVGSGAVVCVAALIATDMGGLPR